MQRNSTLATLALSLSLALPLVGCRAGSEYHAPKEDAPAAWSEPLENSRASEPLAHWWHLFGDPDLDQLIERAAKANLDLELARARLREARATREASRSATEPRVDLSAGYARARNSANTEGSPGSRVSNLWQAGLDASWELDLFGRNENIVGAAQAGLESAEFGVRDALVSVFGEIARNYVDLRGVQKEIAVARANAASQSDTLGLTHSLFDAGLATGLDVARAEAQVATTQSQIPELERQARADMHQLAVLLGEAPGAIDEQLSADAPLPLAPEALATGTPSELLRRRPDIRRAERDLAQAHALANVAAADLYPRISLSATLGQQSSGFWDLLNASSRAWSIGPSLLMPIFDRGAIKAQIQASDERAKQSLIRYQETVLVAFAEVEDALSAVAHARERVLKLQEAVDADRRAVDLASELRQRGLASFFEVLDAQRAQFVVESALAQGRTNLSIAVVSLYKALGGGWEEHDQVAQQ